MSSNAARAASAPKPRRRPERPAMNKGRSFDRYEGAALVLPGFTAFGPEWPWRGGKSAPPFRHLARRSGRIPAEPYPPARCCQYRPAEADHAQRISQSDLPEPTPARYNYPCPAKLPLAAFEVTLIGRFSSDPRGSAGSRLRSHPQVQLCSTCRRTRQTSTQLRSSSPNSKRCCEERPTAASTHSGQRSASCSNRSHRTSVRTTSRLASMCILKSKAL